MQLTVETTEKDLRSILDAAGIEGVSTNMIIYASTDSDLCMFAITLAAQVPLGLVVNWFYDQMIQRKRGNYNIHSTNIINNGVIYV